MLIFSACAGGQDIDADASGLAIVSVGLSVATTNGGK